MAMMRAGLIALIIVVVSLSASVTANGEDSLTLGGSVVTSEPVTFPDGAILTITIEDVSLADAPAVTLAQTTMPVGGRQTPIAFTLPYPAAAVTPRAVYAARARVNAGDQLLFTTTQHNPVDALNPSPIELTLSAVAPEVSLTETYWKLTDIDGQPVQIPEQMREPSIVLHTDGRFSGSGGVNRLMGGYTLDGSSLVFGNAASTMMAGPPEAMAQEQTIIAVLGRVRGFRVVGDRLTLLDESGRPVLTAVAVALR